MTMTRHSALRTLLGFAFAGCTLLAVPLAQGAHAMSANPSITAVADAVSFGVVMVSGQNFEPSDAITIEVIDPATGAVMQKIATSSSSTGGFTRTFAITGACSVGTAELEAVDNNTNEMSGTISVSLPSPLTLVKNQLQGAENTLQSLLATPPSLVDTAAWLGYLQQVTAAQSAVIAMESQVGTATSAACS
jgi:hypothetical protein